MGLALRKAKEWHPSRLPPSSRTSPGSSAPTPPPCSCMPSWTSGRCTTCESKRRSVSSTPLPPWMLSAACALHRQRTGAQPRADHAELIRGTLSNRALRPGMKPRIVWGQWSISGAEQYGRSGAVAAPHRQGSTSTAQTGSREHLGSGTTARSNHHLALHHARTP